MASHSEELERELENCQRFLDDAQNANDVSRVIQLMRVFSSLHKDIEKAKTREGKYLDEKAIAAHDAKFMADVVEKFRGYMQRLYDREITPVEAWQQLVDELIGE